MPAPGIYDREFEAVEVGMHTYRASVGGGGSQAQLRRNIHRLEKGLTMRPRRNLFAAEYIAETVDSLEKARHRPNQSMDELCWATDVLRRYFAATREDETTTPARRHFERLEPDLPGSRSQGPYLRDHSLGVSVRFDDLLALSRHRRSVRWFLPKKVPRDLIDKALLVAREAPSACNRQPFVFRAFDHPDRVRELAAIPMGAAGYAHQIPLLIVVVGQQRNFSDPRDRHLIYIDGALAGMSFILALETLGLSSCVLNWPDIAQKELAMREALQLEPDERPVFLVAVGYPDPEAEVAGSSKRPVSELLRFE